MCGCKDAVSVQPKCPPHKLAVRKWAGAGRVQRARSASGGENPDPCPPRLYGMAAPRQHAGDAELG